jgi:glycosyltransferase involved in cell wall biosynthesis
MTGSPRILGLVEGGSANRLSGIPDNLFRALERRLPVVRTVDYSLHGPARLAVAAATFRPSRAAWRARFHTSRLSQRALSSALARRLAEVDEEFDLVLQVLAWVRGQPRPYALYVDQTRLMAERGWPEWMPFTGRERAELLSLEREMYGEAIHLFTMGAQARDSLAGDYGVDPSRITVVGGGLSFEPFPAPADLSPDPRILFVGREFERKGGDCLIRAFEAVRRELPDATLDIVGISGRFDAPGVRCHGKVSDRSRLAEHYRSARAFCLPSRYEPYGLVLLEAMAHGVPCVGTTVESIPEILDEGRAGLLVPPGDPGSLADALLRLLTDDDLARSFGATGRRRVEQELTWDHVAERIASVLSRDRAAA